MIKLPVKLPTQTKIPPAKVIFALENTYKFGQMNAFHQRESGYGDGICRGVCLDWMRRIMNGKPVIYGYNDPQSDKGKKRLKQQAKTQQALDRAMQQFELEVVSLKNKRDEANSAVESKEFWGPLKFWGKSVTELQKDLNDSIGALQTELDDVKNTGIVGSSFDGFKTIWKDSVRSSSGGAKKAQFNFNVKECAKRDITKPGKLEIFLLAKLFTLPPGQCAMFGVNFLSGGGHAVAVYHETVEIWFLLDPNYGIFCSTTADPKNALLYLFETVYPSHGFVEDSIFELRTV